MANYIININNKQYKVKGDMETQSGRKKIFDALGIDTPTEAPTITDNGFTYTYGSKPKAVIGSETLKEKKTNTRKGIDKFIGTNRSARFDKASGQMGNTWMFHPQDYINKDYWKSGTHKAVREGANTATAIASAPFAAYTAVQAAPFIFNGLRVAGQAMTPSTWIEGISNGLGYTAPKWLSTGADLALSAYFANEAGKEIDRNGLNWQTGANALLSLSPLTKETEAIEGVANTVKKTKDKVIKTGKQIIDDFKKSRIKSNPTYSLNPEYESISQDEEFYLPYSNFDWFNKAKKYSKGETLPDGTISSGYGETNFPYLEQYFPKFTKYDLEYDNGTIDKNAVKFEQNGHTYEVSRAPNNFDYIIASIDNGDWHYFDANGFQDSNEQVANFILKHRDYQIKKYDPYTQDIIKLGNNADKYDENLTLADYSIDETNLGNLFKSKVKKDIEEFYNSDLYVDRVNKALFPKFNNQQVKNIIQYNLNKLYDKAKPILYVNDSHEGGISNTINDIPYYGLNSNMDYSYLPYWDYTLTHEFGHNQYKEDNEFFNKLRDYNKYKIDNTNLNNLTPLGVKAINNSDEYFIYLSSANEFRQRILEGIKYGIQNNLTPEQIYDKCFVPGFNILKQYFKKDYIIRMLETLIATTPFITNDNPT